MISFDKLEHRPNLSRSSSDRSSFKGERSKKEKAEALTIIGSGIDSVRHWNRQILILLRFLNVITIVLSKKIDTLTYTTLLKQ